MPRQRKMRTSANQFTYRDLDIAVPGEVKHGLGYAILVRSLRVGSGRRDELVLLLQDSVVKELVLLEVLCRT